MVGGQPAPFGELLRRYREAAGCSQEELAERAGLSKNAIGTLERGERRRPYPDTLRRLADALELSAADRARLAAAATGAGAPPCGSAMGAERGGPATPAFPASVEPLIGREREAEELVHLLGQLEVRLLTLTGPSGVGKTRLAIEAARRALDRFPDGAAYVSLAPLQDPALVLPSVARALSLGEAGGHTPRDTLHGYLRDRELLLVLDNCEHLLPVAPDLAELLLACSRLTLLATSRAPLRLCGEQEYPVPPLGLPDLSRVPPFEEVAQAAAVQLFVRRGRQVAPAFALAPSNALPVAAICRRLDGLPLAIELAAARVKLLPPAALLARLDHALPLLTGGARDLPARQQTLRDTIAWSHDLLGPEEQALFRRLAVFAGGCTLDAAEAICGPDLAVLDGLAALVDRSLVRSEATGGPGGEPRFAMLETIREYATERLAASGEEEATRHAHAGYYLRLAETAERRPDQAGQGGWLARLAAEQDNLRAALAWALARDADTALRLCGALVQGWLFRTMHGEARAWVERALALPGAAASPAYPRALLAAGRLFAFPGTAAAARPYLEHAVALLRERRPVDRALLGRALGYLAVAVAMAEGSTAAPDLAREGVALARAAGDEPALGDALFAQGQASLHRGDLAAARRALEESYALSRRQGDLSRLGWTAGTLGDIARIAGDYARARPLYEEALAIVREQGGRGDLAAQLHNLGYVAVARGEAARARALLGESLALQRELDNAGGVAEGLAGFAALAVAEGQGERAARLLGSATAIWEGHNLPLWPAERAEYERTTARARAQVDEETWQRAWDEGRTMTPEQAAAYTLEEPADG